MAEKIPTRDELLVLLRDMFLKINDIHNKLRDFVLENTEDIVCALSNTQCLRKTEE